MQPLRSIMSSASSARKAESVTLCLPHEQPYPARLIHTPQRWGGRACVTFACDDVLQGGVCEGDAARARYGR